MNISGKIESTHVAVYRDVSNAAKTLDIPFVVVGAAARDLVLHYGYGARIVRATTDIDFGIEIANAAAYESLVALLVESRYEKSDMPHRLLSPNGVMVDLVPFGSIATVGGDVLLPPNETHKMNVIGFQEVCDSADLVAIQTKPHIVIPVATPAGVALLKIIAWTDRAANLRKKDASDLAYLMKNYEKIPEIIDIIYDDALVLEHFDWNTALAGAFVLGRDTRAIASNGALGIVAKLRNGEFKNKTLETLEYEMCRTSHDDAELERKGELLKAFIQGFFDED